MKIQIELDEFERNLLMDLLQGAIDCSVAKMRRLKNEPAKTNTRKMANSIAVIRIKFSKAFDETKGLL